MASLITAGTTARMWVNGLRCDPTCEQQLQAGEASIRVDVTTPGYRGLVFVDRDTNEVSRITLDADMPPSFPIQMATTVLDYDSTDISGIKFMLPLRAEVRMRAGKELVKNEVEFRMYRKFGTDTSIKFDIPEPLPSDATTEQPPKQ
jgi:hypothetical protein